MSNFNTSRVFQIAASVLLTSGLLSFDLVAQVPAPAKKDAKKDKVLKPDPEVAKMLKNYKSYIKDRKAQRDPEAIAIIDKLLTDKWSGDGANMHPKDKKAFAKGIAESLKSTKCKRKPEQGGIYRTTVVALGRIGSLGSSHLWSAFENKKFKGKKEWLSLRGEIIEHLGRTKDEKYTKHLLDVACRDTSDALMAAAGKALRHFKESKLAQRKVIAKGLIKKFSQIYDNANKNLDPSDLTVKSWKDRLAAVSDPWNGTLQKLTKQSFREANLWNKFWNKNKNANWDKRKKKSRR